MTPRVSIVVPAYNEGATIVPCVDRILEAVTMPCEVLVVYDSQDDSTAPYAEKLAGDDDRVIPTLNTYGRGPARAIRFGIHQTAAEVIVVTMADGSDDVTQIDHLVRLVERGAAVAAASRYMPGGQQVGGPRLKGLLSRGVGLSLYWLARVGTRDPTSSFKAYSKRFVESVGIASDAGFEVAIELVAKARRLRLPIVEVPTIWLDRVEGSSNFQLREWALAYLRWYLFSFGPRLTVEQVRRSGVR